MHGRQQHKNFQYDLGIDLGIGSMGWACISPFSIDPVTGEILNDFEIIDCGARCFQIPEDPKSQEPKNVARRAARGIRRNLSRRHQKLKAVRKIMAHAGLPTQLATLSKAKTDQKIKWGELVWHLRVEALDHQLNDEEFARILIHLAKHRGWKANSKKDLISNEGGGKFKDDFNKLRDLTAEHKSTYAKVLLEHKDYKDLGVRRNRDGNYGLIPLRDLIEQEAHDIFRAQRDFGNTKATTQFEKDFCDEAFSQRPLKSVEGMIGQCTFETHEKRCPKQTPSFEKFRYVQTLNNLRIKRHGTPAQPLSIEERSECLALVGTQKQITLSTLQKTLGLSGDDRFEGYSKDQNKKVIGDFSGTSVLKEALGGIRFHELSETTPQTLDGLAYILIYEDDLERLKTRLRTLLNEPDFYKIHENEDVKKRFAQFSGVGHLSAKAIRNILPHLEKGLTYDKACQMAGYDHTAQQWIDLNRDVRNPIVRKVLKEATKQIKAIIKRYGMPEKIFIEMARDVGRNEKERRGIQSIQEFHEKKNKEAESFFEEHLAGLKTSQKDKRRYNLWADQQERCVYCQKHLSPRQILKNDNTTEVDHILPYSRSLDDSYNNKILACSDCNQAKKNKTPYEWFGGDHDRWRTFIAYVEGCKKIKTHKKKLLLTTTYSVRQEEYIERHKNDTRYAICLLKTLIEQDYPEYRTDKGENRRFFARPGAITAMVRKSWGLNKVKADGTLGDRDHALDAIIVACTTESTLQYLTRWSQADDEIRYQRVTMHLPTPLGNSEHERETFRKMVLNAVEDVFVSRPSVGRQRGQAHNDTLYSFIPATETEEEKQFEVKKVIKLECTEKKDDLNNLRGDPARTRILRETLSAWLKAQKASGLKPEKFFETHPPRMPRKGETPGSGTGPIIHKVHLKRSASAGYKIKRGDGQAHVDNSNMVRVDVFKKDNKHFLVPIYGWQMRTMEEPPMRATVKNKPEDNWIKVDCTFKFLFSLYPGNYIEAENEKGTTIKGYYKGFDRNSNRISYALPHDYHPKDQKKKLRFSPQNYKSIRKFHINRFGERFDIKNETRTWPAWDVTKKRKFRGG